MIYVEIIMLCNIKCLKRLIRLNMYPENTNWHDVDLMGSYM